MDREDFVRKGMESVRPAAESVKGAADVRHLGALTSAAILAAFNSFLNYLIDVGEDDPAGMAPQAEVTPAPGDIPEEAFQAAHDEEVFP